MSYERMAEIAAYLKRPQDVDEISTLEQLEQEGKLYLTLWGHYSSGKSCLLNHLLGRDILPVRSKETTAALTYISYGDVENALLYMDDGSVEGINLEDIKTLFEGSDADGGRLAHVEHIEITLQEEWLRNGLVLVDTPGVNTILQRHQDLALAAVKQAGRILYCLGGAPSKVDADFIKMMVDCGITITFARTKCDLFHEDEENPIESLQGEKENLAAITGQDVKDIEFYPLSNEKDAPIWYEKGQVLKDFLLTLAQHAGDVLAESCQKRVAILKEEYKKKLQEQLDSYENMLQGQSEKQQEKLVDCERQIQRLQQNVEKRSERLKDDIAKSKRQADISARTMAQQGTASFVSALEGLNHSETIEADVEAAYEEQMKKSILAFQIQLNGYFDDIAKNDQDFCHEDLGVMAEPPAYEDIEEGNAAALEEYRQQLVVAKEKYEALQQKQQHQAGKLKEQAAALEGQDYTQTIQNIQAQLAEIPQEPCTRYIEPEGIQPSEVLGKLGSSIDTVGMFLLPEKAIANTVVKAGKVVNIAMKARQVRNVVRTVNNAQKMMQLTKNKVSVAQPGLLDYLSFEYWLKRAGSAFDAKPRQVIDEEAETQRQEALRQLQEQYNQAAEANIQRKLQLGLIKDEQEAMIEREKAQRQAVMNAETEFQRKKQAWELEQVRERMRKFKDKYIRYFQKNITTVFERMTASQYEGVKANMELYIQQKNARLLSDVKRKKDDLLSIQAVAEQGRDALEREISQCKSYLDVVKEVR